MCLHYIVVGKKRHVIPSHLPLSILRSVSSPVTSTTSSGGLPGWGSSSCSSGGSSSECGSSLSFPAVSTKAGFNSGGSNFLSTGDLGLLDFLSLLGLGITVEVQVDDDVPFGFTGSEGAAETEDFTGKQPPDETDGVTTLVVGGDGDVDEFGGRVGVAEGDDWDVNVAGLADGLAIGARVGDDNQAGFLEGAGDVVSEATGGETTGDGDGTGVSGELEDGTLTVGTSGDDANVGWVVDGCDDTGSEDDLLPAIFEDGA